MNWNRITIHHTGGNISDTAEGVRRYHMEKRGWSDVGYHWLLRWSFETPPQILQGRPMYRTGSHAYRNNTGNIGVALIGDFSTVAPPMAMVEAAGELCAALCASHGIRTDAIVAHRDLRATACPGLVPMDALRAIVAGLRGGRYPRAADLL